MAVELTELYKRTQPRYDLKLLTDSCFQKLIGWTHMVEDLDFVHLLHGDELVLNSGLNYASEDWLKEYIQALDKAHAGGLVIALRDGKQIEQDTIDYCNSIKFPLFAASWATPYVDIMRIFSVALLENEKRETNLIAALKNAIFYPDNKELYLNHFESNGFYRDMDYVVVILSCYAYNSENGNKVLQELEEKTRHLFKKCIVYEEQNRLIVLISGHNLNVVEKQFQKIGQKDKNICAGIGTKVQQIQDIHESYENAYTAYLLTKKAMPQNILSYEDLGVYKLLSHIKEPDVCMIFLQETLGKLLDYDKEHDSEYMKVLETYFEQECSIIESAKTLYCHKNTMTYKLNKIKDILGYDILSNENRVKIMMSFYILRGILSVE